MIDAMVEPQPPEILVSRAQAGARDAFDELAARYRERLLESIRARFPARDGSLCEPEDVLSETLLRAFEGLGSFEWEGEESFLRWLFGISRNIRLHELRRQRATLSLRAAERELSKDPTPSRALRREERFDRLEQAITDLPADYREVIRLSRLEGLKTKEVAARLGKSTDAVKHLLARAVQMLRRQLDETGSLSLPDRRIGEEGGTDGE